MITFENTSSVFVCSSLCSDRQKMIASEKVNLIYGEVTLEAIREVFLHIEAQLPTFSQSRGKFYDLGSGSGRSLLMATVVHHFEVSIGIEIVPSLHRMSIALRDYWAANEVTNRLTHIDFHLGSILNLSLCDWTDGDVVFANSTCFNSELFDAMVEIGKRLKSGAIFITLTSDIQCPEFRVIGELRLPMSW